MSIGVAAVHLARARKAPSPLSYSPSTSPVVQPKPPTETELRNQAIKTLEGGIVAKKPDICLPLRNAQALYNYVVASIDHDRLEGEKPAQTG